MQALYVTEGRVAYRKDYPRPVLAVGEALVRPLVMGICATDLEIVKGYVPGFDGVLGHEFVGEVVEAADEGWVGQRVVASINIGCGQCAVCWATGPEHCGQREVVGIHRRDGVFADYVAVPTANLLAVPDGVTDEAAVFTEPLAAALRIREQVMVRPTTRVAVVGPGRLGLLVAQVLQLAGSQVLVLGRRSESLVLPQALGLAVGLVAAQAAKGFDLVVETTGNEAGLAAALRLTRPLGTIIMKSTYAGKAQVDLTPLVVGEITAVGSRCGPFAPALRLLARNEVAVTPLIAAEYRLREGEAALVHAGGAGVRKVLLRP